MQVSRNGTRIAQLHGMPPTDSSVLSVLQALQVAFRGERNARARYLTFAQQADIEGHAPIAALFRAIAQAESIHASNHAKLILRLGNVPGSTPETLIVSSTRENLAASARDEHFERESFYPPLITYAHKARKPESLRSLILAALAESCHGRLFADALSKLEANQPVASDYFVCSVCGNVVNHWNSRRCNVCHQSGEQCWSRACQLTDTSITL